MRCLLLTSIDQKMDRAELEQAGIVQVMTKPIRRNELRAAILNAVSRERLPAAAPRRRLVARGHSPNPDGLRVLVAEDNVVNQRVARLQLEKLGHRVDVVANGLEVLEAVERVPYDVILMDCQMPEMDGYEATRRLRSASSRREILIVAMTAHAMEGDRELCLAAGMNDYVSKPMRSPELEAALERMRRMRAENNAR
jgi:CheY-like chemotaxis protein